MDKGKELGNRRRHSGTEKVINNEDLLIEILVRLPAKSCVKFKCVSKKWLSVISDSDFASLHTRLNPNNVSSALILSNLKFLSISNPNSEGHPEQLCFPMDLLTSSQPTMKIKDEPYIVDSCNGLLLCHVTVKYDGARFTCYIACNPTTLLFSFLPMIHYTWKRNRVCLVFDPSKSPQFLVVEARFNQFHGERGFDFVLYDSKLDTWTEEMKLDYPNEWGNIACSEFFWNGAIHWIGDGGYHILFDPYSRELTGIKLPEMPKIQKALDIQYFGECDGRLFLIQNGVNTTRGFFVFEMGGDYCSWIRLDWVNMRRIAKAAGLEVELRLAGFEVMSIVKRNKGEGPSVVVRIFETTFCHVLETEECDVLEDLAQESSAFPFIQTLAPVC